MKAIGIAYILWLPPMGLLGIHRFYCGRVATGLLWLFTGGLVGLGWLVDVFLVPGMVREANIQIMPRLRERVPLGLAPVRRETAGVSDDRLVPNEGPPCALLPDHRVIYCTRCGGAMQVPIDAVGRQYGCPSCRTILGVPG